MPAPDTRVVELRVAATRSTSPEALVDGLAAVDVAGDGVGRLVRPADRVRRPAPGPVLFAAGRPVPRTVEGYLWGAMTGRRAGRAVRGLLLPYTLANTAYWMLPPPRPGALAPALRALLRAWAVLLTALLAAQLTEACLELFAAPRATAGLLPAAVVLLGLHTVGMVGWSSNAPQPTGPPGAHSDTTVPGSAVGAGLAGKPDAAGLRALHTTAALATAAVLGTAGQQGPSGWVWAASVTLLGLCVLGAALQPDPHRGSLPARVPRWLLVIAGLLAVGSAGILAEPRDGPGPVGLLGLLAALLTTGWALLAVLLMPAARHAMAGWRGLAPQQRPWARGWAAAPVLALAALLGAGGGAALGLAARLLAPGRTAPLPAWYLPLVAGWALAVTLLAAAAAAAAVVVRLPRAGIRPELVLLHPAPSPVVAAAWRRAALLQRGVPTVVLALPAVVVLGATAVWGAGPAPAPPRSALLALGVAGLAGVGGLAGVVLAGRRRRDGGWPLLAGLASSWPRRAHPLVPPCPTLKVVPELVARVEQHLADPAVRVVLAGQGHGSVLALVAAARLVERLAPVDRDRVGLLTAGSPVTWAGSRAFPAVFGHDALAALAGSLGGRWRALCRGTDPLGGAVTTWGRKVFDGELLGTGLRPDGTVGPLPPARSTPHGAFVLGADHWLPDPQRAPVEGHRWHPGLLGSQSYSTDPEWDAAVAVAAGLVPAPASAAGRAEHGSPASRWPPRASGPAGGR